MFDKKYKSYLKLFFTKKTNRLFIFLAFVIGAGIGTYLVLPSLNNFFDLPNLDNVQEYELISSIELYDYNDKFVGFLSAEEDRQVVPLSEISPYLQRAVLAIEDKDFYAHRGIDPSAIIRAIFINLQSQRIVEGASTITQQLVKNLFIPENERGRTFSRKAKEILLAIELEKKIDKDEILELYLNQVFWGSRAYGAQRAAQKYFNKSANNLTLSESAYLAGLLQAPSRLSKKTDEAILRKNLVLKKMNEFGFITNKQYEKGQKEKLQFRSTPGQFELYPYYFSYVLEELKQRFDVKDLKTRGYKVYTGLDPDAQIKAERILNQEIKNAPSGVTQYALASIDIKTGQVRALVGGVGNYWKHQWNRATNPHTIGSAFKPFVYLSAIEARLINSGTEVDDSEVSYPDNDTQWVPRNFDNSFWGTINIREALVNSRNIPAVKVAHYVGIRNVIKMAKACGIETELHPNLSLALGSAAISPLEAAASYATFARGGIYIKPILIRKIEDRNKKIIEKNDPVQIRVASSDSVSVLISILQDVVKRGTGTLARLEDRPVAGKTGTSDKSRDVWFIGFTPDYSTAIWGGNDHSQPIYGKGVTGGAIVARVWKKYYQAYYANKDISAGSFPDEALMEGVLAESIEFAPEGHKTKRSGFFSKLFRRHNNKNNIRVATR
jgi:1A family penicillin-binding protein